MWVMTVSSLPSMIKTLSFLTSLQSGLMYVWPPELPIIAFKAVADSEFTISKSEKLPVLPDAGAALTILTAARNKNGRANMKSNDRSISLRVLDEMTSDSSWITHTASTATGSAHARPFCGLKCRRLCLWSHFPH